MRVKAAPERIKFLIKQAKPVDKKFVLKVIKHGNTVEEDKIDIVKVGEELFKNEDYIKKSNGLWIRCSRHSEGTEQNRSLWVGGNKNIFTCFGCSVGGGPVRMVSWWLGVSLVMQEVG